MMFLKKFRSVWAMLTVLAMLAALLPAAWAQEAEKELAEPDNTAWHYNADADVYWQVGMSYCAEPADAELETLGIYVPGAYFIGTDNGDGTYTCTVNLEGRAGGYTADAAPIVIPVNTPGYSAMSAPTGWSDSVTAYTDAGFVYVWAGCRGRDAGAPAGVTDLKAAIRYIRMITDTIPGDAESIFVFGMSGGGAQSAILGASGDSALYTPYLQAIGAAMDESDAVAGAMCWCPITSLTAGDMAYEWNMGMTRSGLSEQEQALSDGLAEAFADYINNLGLTDSAGNLLTLEPSEEGIYQAGSYYDLVQALIENSLETYLATAEFPLSVDSGSSAGFGGMPEGAHGGRDGELPTGSKPDRELPDGNLPDGELPDGELPDGNTIDAEAAQYAADGVARTEGTASATVSGTYETPNDYIDGLNADGKWVVIDPDTGSLMISSVADFVSTYKKASKSLGAFDQLDRGQAENMLFGYADGSGAHFDSTLASILAGIEGYEEEAAAYAEDLARTDALGVDVQTRVNMYDPLYYLCSSSEGFDSSVPARFWRIRTGINQTDTALTTELNLALATEALGLQTDFAVVWNQGHTEAEITGTSTQNFIAWVNSCTYAG